MIPTDLKKLILKYDPGTGSFVIIHRDGYWFDGKTLIDWPIGIEFGRYFKFYKGFLLASRDNENGVIELFQFKKPAITINISQSNHFLFAWSCNYVQFEQYLYKINVHSVQKSIKMNLKGEFIETLPVKNVPNTGYHSFLPKGFIYRLGTDIHEKYEIKSKKWTQIQSKSLRDVFELGATKRIFGITCDYIFELIDDKWIYCVTIKNKFKIKMLL